MRRRSAGHRGSRRRRDCRPPPRAGSAAGRRDRRSRDRRSPIGPVVSTSRRPSGDKRGSRGVRRPSSADGAPGDAAGPIDPDERAPAAESAPPPGRRRGSRRRKRIVGCRLLVRMPDVLQHRHGLAGQRRARPRRTAPPSASCRARTRCGPWRHRWGSAALDEDLSARPSRDRARPRARRRRRRAAEQHRAPAGQKRGVRKELRRAATPASAAQASRRRRPTTRCKLRPDEKIERVVRGPRQHRESGPGVIEHLERRSAIDAPRARCLDRATGNRSICRRLRRTDSGRRRRVHLGSRNQPRLEPIELAHIERRLDRSAGPRAKYASRCAVGRDREIEAAERPRAAPSPAASRRSA